MKLTAPLILMVACVPALTWAAEEQERAASINLPPLLGMADGTQVVDAATWRQRRGELRELIQYYEYGHLPPRPDAVTATQVQVTVRPSLGAREERMTLRIGSREHLAMRIAVYRPVAAADQARLPVIVREEHALGHVDEVPLIMSRDFLYVEFAREDLAPDSSTGVSTVHEAYPDHDGATLAVWAWAAMRVVDYLETRDDVNLSQVAIVGHSRGGKMALLAGALDERFTLVAANGSGCGGAGCFRIGADGVETLELITRPDRFGYWFHPRLRAFAGREDELPIDQHFVKALVAPRALLCTEASGDRWANPTGTRTTSLAAQSVFDLLGASEKNGVHFRDGQHDLTTEDWQAILDFADWHFRGILPDNKASFQDHLRSGENHTPE